MTEETPEKRAIDLIEEAKKTAKDTLEAARIASELLIEKTRKETGQMIVDSIKTAFGQGEEEQKIVRLNRVPYICEDIREIKKKQDKMMSLIWMGLGGLGVITFFLPIVLHYFWK